MSVNIDGEFMLKDKRNYTLFKNIENVILKTLKKENLHLQSCPVRVGKNLHVSESTQFKLVLFKGQLYDPPLASYMLICCLTH